MDEVEGGLLPVSCFDLLQMVIVLVGPESDHLSLTDSPLGDLIDVTLACEDANSILMLLLWLMLVLRNMSTTVLCRF